MALEIEKLGFYSNVCYQTFLMPDFSPLGQTRKVLSWLLQHESDTDPEILLKRKFRFEMEQTYTPCEGTRQGLVDNLQITL